MAQDGLKAVLLGDRIDAGQTNVFVTGKSWAELLAVWPQFLDAHLQLQSLLGPLPLPFWAKEVVKQADNVRALVSAVAAKLVRAGCDMYLELASSGSSGSPGSAVPDVSSAVKEAAQEPIEVNDDDGDGDGKEKGEDGELLEVNDEVNEGAEKEVVDEAEGEDGAGGEGEREEEGEEATEVAEDDEGAEGRADSDSGDAAAHTGGSGSDGSGITGIIAACSQLSLLPDHHASRWCKEAAASLSYTRHVTSTLFPRLLLLKNLFRRQ